MANETIKIDSEHLEEVIEIKRKISKASLLAQKAKIDEMLAKLESK